MVRSKIKSVILKGVRKMMSMIFKLPLLILFFRWTVKIFRYFLRFDKYGIIKRTVHKITTRVPELGFLLIRVNHYKPSTKKKLTISNCLNLFGVHPQNFNWISQCESKKIMENLSNHENDIFNVFLLNKHRLNNQR